MTRHIAIIGVVLVLAAAVAAAPVAAEPGPASGSAVEFTRTECVIATGAPGVYEMTGKGGKVLHIRDFPYLGFLSDGEEPTGYNQGAVAIDLNTVSGTGSIRGTLGISDEVMGDYVGEFSGHYKGGVWVARGVAQGVADSAGKQLKMWVTGLDPATCGDDYDYVDAARWDITISG